MKKMSVIRGVLILTVIYGIAVWIPSQPNTNVWVTLANLTGQEAICLALSSPGNPFSTCLVGVPVDTWPCPSNIPTCSATNVNSTVDSWDQWVQCFPIASAEPQEIELLGSVQMDACVMFNWSSKSNTHPPINVNSTLPVYRNTTIWCQYITSNLSISSNNPIQLPPGIFLICRDRAWPGIPTRLRGGPCSLGRLTLLTPNTSMILNVSRHHYKQARTKRMTHVFSSSCKDTVKFWNPETIIAASILAPGVAAARVLAQQNRLGCWLSKQTNATSKALSELLLDVDSVRHATLQNRAAIDFSLLTEGHSCEEFEGMCCMNLSDHLKSIYRQLSELQELVGKLQVSDNLGLDKWLKGLGLFGWLKETVKGITLIVIIVIVTLLIVPCLLHCCQRVTGKWLNQVLIVQKLKGGIVEDWLRRKGHQDAGSLRFDIVAAPQPWNNLDI